jgi:hypothetical protein
LNGSTWPDLDASSRGTLRLYVSAVPRLLDIGLESDGTMLGGVGAKDTLAGPTGETQPFYLGKVPEITENLVCVGGDEDLAPGQKELV